VARITWTFEDISITGHVWTSLKKAAFISTMCAVCRVTCQSQQTTASPDPPSHRILPSLTNCFLPMSHHVIQHQQSTFQCWPKQPAHMQPSKQCFGLYDWTITALVNFPYMGEEGTLSWVTCMPARCLVYPFDSIERVSDEVSCTGQNNSHFHGKLVSIACL
jgi:hypothetical protein